MTVFSIKKGERMFKLFLNIIIISSVFSSAKGFCATDIQLLGRWLDSENKKGYEFIEGFGPNVGIALIIKDSKVKDIEKWNFNREFFNEFWTLRSWSYEVHIAF